MPSVAASVTQIEWVLVEITSLLLERARTELEHEVEATGESARDAAASNLRRMRELEDVLRSIRQDPRLAESMRAQQTPGRQVSRFYEVPGQEDA